MKRVVSSLFILLFLFGVIVLADDITLDGDFTDWGDKPAIEAVPEPVEPQAVPEAAENTAQEQALPTDAPQPNDITSPSATNEPKQSATSAPSEPEQSAPPAEGLIVEDNAQSLQVEEQSKENNNGIKFKIHQLRWLVSDTDNTLYIMARLSHPKELSTGSFTTHFLTDFGEFDAITTYDTGDGTVLSIFNGQPVEVNGKCDIINKNTIELEYGIPLALLIKDLKMGYLLKFKVISEDDEEPKNSYITVCTASTMPFLGVGICAAIGIGVPYLMKRKRKS